MTSFDSVKGPSITVCLPSARRMRMASAIGRSPAVSSSTPALVCPREPAHLLGKPLIRTGGPFRIRVDLNQQQVTHLAEPLEDLIADVNGAGCALSVAISSATLPLMSREFAQFADSRVVEKTTLSTLFTHSACARSLAVPSGLSSMFDQNPCIPK
jgi:hypothetical protein